MYNHVTICGRLTQDPQLRDSKNQIPYLRFTIAVNNPYSKVTSTVFVEAIAWRSNAVNMVKFLKRGSLVLIDGKLQNIGNSGLEVSVNSVYFMESKKSTNAFEDQKKPSTTVESISKLNWEKESNATVAKNNLQTTVSKTSESIDDTNPKKLNKKDTQEKTSSNSSNDEGIDWDAI